MCLDRLPTLRQPHTMANRAVFGFVLASGVLGPLPRRSKVLDHEPSRSFVVGAPETEQVDGMIGCECRQAELRIEPVAPAGFKGERAFVLETPAKTCHERNRASDEPVPSEVIDRMAKAWDPVVEEGITARTVDGEG